MTDLLQLIEYNFWANDQVIGRLQEQDNLPAEIEKLFSHLLNAQKIWIGRVDKNIEKYDVWQNHSVADWEGINIELFHNTNLILKSHGPARRIRYQNSSEQWFEHSLAEIIHHIINHSTHHRAQVCLLMRQHLILPPQTDYILFLRR